MIKMFKVILLDNPQRFNLATRGYPINKRRIDNQAFVTKWINFKLLERDWNVVNLIILNWPCTIEIAHAVCDVWR